MLKDNRDGKPTINTKQKTHNKKVPYAAGLRKFELRMRTVRVPV